MLSMEGLIDLEQQVEFLLVLGNGEDAIDLLTSHLDGNRTSPIPYFWLLELYRDRGDAAAHARIAEAFHQHFGAQAASWDAPAGQGRPLAQYPKAIARLQRAWADPSEAMQVLEGWVFRRLPVDETFDFAATREML